MKCLSCGSVESKVIDSRTNDDCTSIRRRRQCMECGKRFTTYESIEVSPIMVIKKSGVRQEFSREKLMTGVCKACEKRPIPVAVRDGIIDKVEKAVSEHPAQEVTTDFIGDMVMDELKQVDDVAYVRYAAVHREFKDINSWYDTIKDLVGEKDE